MKKEEIKFHVSLDENHVPDKLAWESTDSGKSELRECEAFMLSIWDKKENNALRIDLWTKEMKVDEMKYFVHQTLASLSETYLRATDDEELATDMKKFSAYFAKKAQLYQDN
ncbi:MAG: gliding motility protein GldC [Flavobacteriales bacterium]|jgi:gliding motility-associated protein GldC|nr:gliding motility protein GldC [Flavobacteriales bacterium]